MADQPKYRIVAVGLGAQGSGIVDMLCDLGHDLVGVIDVGAKVGQPVSALTTSSSVPELTVRATIGELLDSLAEPPHIAAIAASLSLEALLDMAGGLLDRGINVITLHPDVFARDDSWAKTLNERAVAGGASFLATGVQDSWWVQLPSLVTSSSVSVDAIRIVSTLSLEQLSPTIGDMLGVGGTPEEFPAQAEKVLSAPAVLGAPLAEAARRMGATASVQVRDVQPVIAELPYRWDSAGVTIPAGRVVGTRETVSFDTDRGIRFDGVLEVLPITKEETADELHVRGVPDHHLRYQPFCGLEITNVALVARVPDVVAAAPGVLFSAELPPASHQFRRS